MMDCRQEPHVAQQSRRDKLRAHHSNDFSNAWDHNINNVHALHHQHHPQGMNPDLIELRNSIRIAGSPHNPALVPPGFIGFLHNQTALPVQTDSVHAYQDCASMFMNMPQVIPSSTVLASIRDESHHDPQGCGNWKSVDSSQQPSCGNWVAANYGDVMFSSSSFNDRNDVLDRPLQCLKPMYDAGQDVAARSSLSSCDISSQDDDKKCHMNPLYRQNCLQNNVVTVACSGSMQNDNRESACDRSSWSGNSRGELVFLPSYGHQLPDSWMSRQVESNVNQWTHGSVPNVTRKCGDEEVRNLANVSAKQGLSLSLSPEVPKPSGICTSSGKTLAEVASGGGVATDGSSVHVQRHVGPLGPFTGYATILKSSRFLKPAQQLLDEFCNGYVSRITCRSSSSMESANPQSTEGGKCSEGSALCSPTIRSCNDAEGCSSSEPFKHEDRLKKAKLNLLQEEVCRRYKLYNQQMQTVVSSFETVAGLSAATPFISLALTRITRSFRSLRTAITDQLVQVSRSPRNDNGPTNQTPCSKFSDRDINSDGLSLEKPRSTALCNNVGFLEPQSQHIWRPQRGLPERAVAILRAWLFDHFLHPYPTDTDKQMLATQTGLSRNQVSNWFINARVRVWKPMVEEMHMLETKAMDEAPNADKQNITRTEPTNNNVEYSNRPCNNSFGQNETRKQMMGLQGSNANANAGLEKRSRVEYASASGDVDLSGLMGFMPYNNSQRGGGFDRGLGNVSLTLGLRHGVDSVSQTQTQTHEHQFGGGQMLHDFVG